MTVIKVLMAAGGSIYFVAEFGLTILAFVRRKLGMSGWAIDDPAPEPDQPETPAVEEA